MKLSAKIKVDFRTALAKQMGESFTTECAAAFGDLVQAQAKHNVAPGIGPGPHPHPERIDTGNLMDSIQADIRKSTNAVAVDVYTNVEYGVFLEAGWHTPSGRFARYPWLRPAIETAQREFMNIVRTKAAVAFTGGARGGLVAIKRGRNTWDSFARGWRRGVTK